MIDALEPAMGVITAACRGAGISRETHYKWMKNDTAYAKTVKDMPDICLDYAESKLFKGMKDGNMTAIIFYLKTKGRKRGYIERQELETTNLHKIQGRAIFYIPDNGRDPKPPEPESDKPGDHGKFGNGEDGK